MKRTLSLLIASAVFVLVGCNTMEGAGKDVQKAGEKIEDAAQKKK
jgi:predicted small secreted protein